VESIFIVTKGTLAVLVNGKKVESIKLTPGALIGEVEYFRNIPASGTVLAEEDSELLEINRHNLESFINTHPKAGISIIPPSKRI
jgi:CRP-like cAMP-binding protein